MHGIVTLAAYVQKKRKGKALKPDSHTDAVLALSWNRDYRNVLASGSADTTVKVWDLATEQCSATLDHHADKVQAVAWNPAQASVLLSGGFDQAVCMASPCLLDPGVHENPQNHA